MAPPRDLLPRVRWVFLIAGILNALLLLLILPTVGPSDWPHEAAGVAALSWICSRWILGHRLGRFSVVGDVAEGLALCLISAAVGNPLRALGLLYSGLCFRSLYGSGRRVVLVLLIYVAAHFAVAQALDAVPVLLLRALIMVPIFAVGAGGMLVLAKTLTKHERALAREGILARAGAALVASPTQESTYAVAADAALALIGHAPDARVSVWVGSAERLTSVAAAGDRAAEVDDIQMNVRLLPAPLRERFGSQTIIQLDAVEAAELRKVLPVDPKVNSVWVMPLLIQERLGGLLVAASASALPDDAVDALRTLGIEVALALHRRQIEDRFRSLVQNSSDVIMLIDRELMVRYLTPSVERVFGYEPSALVGARLTTLVHPDDLPRAGAFLAEAMNRPGVTVPVEWRVRHQNGSWLHAETIGNNLLDDPTVRGLVLNTRDVSERKALEGRLMHQAFHDPLTGLANRALFKDRVEHALARATRRRSTVAVLFLDLDDFKAVNDSLGHAAGDELLIAVARRLQGRLRRADTIARLGGDEFAILLEETPAIREAAHVAESVVDALRAPFSLQDRSVLINTSVGIAISTASTESAEELLREADIAMYVAKGHGKGSYRVFEVGMSEVAMERLALKSDLQRAIDHQEFVVCYQPYVALRTGRISGVEALVRWSHPERGETLPADFIPLAEESGLIVPIGRWVLRQACHQALLWQHQFPSNPPLTMSVNLSARQLQDPDLVQDVAAVLAETGLPAEGLVLELTESTLMQETEAAIAKLQELRQLGLRLAIDDFGTGYSSLSQLQRFPIDILKIDKAFVDGVATGSDASALAHAIIALARTLHLRTVAEGIERAEQWDRLRALDCDLGQGYYVARPLAAEEAGVLLHQGNLPLLDQRVAKGA